MRSTVELYPYQTANGLTYGALGNTFSSAANLVSTGVQVVAENTDGDYGIDPNYKKVLAVNSALASTAIAIAGAAQAVPAVGQIIGAVALIVAGIATILGKNKAKVDALKAQKAHWDEINSVLIANNALLDVEIANLKFAIEDMANALGIQINSLNGLGLCIFNCKKKAAQKSLDKSKALNEQLNEEQLERAQLALDLSKLAESMVVAKNTKYIGYALGGAALLIGVLYYLKNR